MRSEELRFSRPEGQLLVVAEEALLTIKSFQQHGPLSHEAGGMLLGRVLLGSNDMIIDRATTPSPNDKRGRFFSFDHAVRRKKKLWRLGNNRRGQLTTLENGILTLKRSRLLHARIDGIGSRSLSKRIILKMFCSS
jgi:hypothetical protein